ncbi:MAG: hypothetical protein GY708_02225 [Actinomycetia bacterium]|nr:hypothetical protein [Actinomycetes bacterium]MCP4961295.1 hypothetical protein [Actinomycetes bacterium]
MAEHSDYDLDFFWDPVCPFAWITSRWVTKVVEQRELSVDWRFISLRIINKDVDYDAHFPAGYEAGHTAGLRMLRVAAAVRANVGRQAMASLYTAFGSQVFDHDPAVVRDTEIGTVASITDALGTASLDTSFAEAADNLGWDDEIEAETNLAFERTGRDVGTPILSLNPPDGPSFFGPVISRVPTDDDAVRLWDAVTTLASFPSFAEMKRSLRERPQLRTFGVEPGEQGIVEDWKSGSRRWN